MLENNQTASETYLRDIEVAKLLNVSRGWVRKQRHLRRRKKEHSLNIDAIYIGRSPRYKASEINQWLNELAINNSNVQVTNHADSQKDALESA